MNSFKNITGIGPKTIAKLNKLKISLSSDLLYHVPSRYIDFSNIISISQANLDESATVTGKIMNFNNIYTRHGKNLQKATVTDKTGSLELIWFNQPYLSGVIKVGMTMSFAGTVSLYQNKKTIIAPEFGQYNTGKIIAVYPETQGLSSKWFRKTIQSNLVSLVKNEKETLPPEILSKYKLPNIQSALTQIHLPTDKVRLNFARIRLAIDELLSLQAQSLLAKNEWLTNKPKKIIKTTPAIKKQLQALIKSLPYKLTESQKKVWGEIQNDLISPEKVTNRLLQGDVGSGKTIIAILASYLVHLNNSLSLILAPTEILAQQHFNNFQNLLNRFGVPVFLLTASTKLDVDKIPKNSIIISTHAAIYKKINLENKVALLVIDEQHKFGVRQRSFLGSSIHKPHCLTMTATPIPRTISLTLLGNLDISTIDLLPKNRLPIKTFLVPNHKKTDCYNWIRDEIKKTGCQAYIVCPFIDISESLSSVKSAKIEFEHLSREVFPDLNLALIHGRMKPEAREKVISQFKNNQVNILITTPIIEVGVDIPNSSIIIIQSADRFGLAQLHQLRGRVGRGHIQSYCYLFTDSENEKAKNRLEFLQNNNSGLKIAEYDLKTRGPGETFSFAQHGFPSLKVASFSDIKLVELTKKILTEITENCPDFDLNTLVKQKTSSEGINN